MNEKPLKDPKGGLTPAGRKAFGGNLRPGVQNYSQARTADKRRWISWALRFYGQDNYPPLKDENGKPTRFALTAAAWGEPVPKTEEEARAIAAKAKKRKAELDNQELKQSSMIDEVETFLSHFGVKGQKWGVRKGKVKRSNPNSRKVRKKDRKWQKKATKNRKIHKVYKKSAKRMNKEVKVINDLPAFKNKDLNANPKLKKKYNDQVSEKFTKILNEEAKRLGSSASGKKIEFVYDGDGSPAIWKVRQGNG
jgi:hypothetical protein